MACLLLYGGKELGGKAKYRSRLSVPVDRWAIKNKSSR